MANFGRQRVLRAFYGLSNSMLIWYYLKHCRAFLYVNSALTDPRKHAREPQSGVSSARLEREADQLLQILNVANRLQGMRHMDGTSST